MVLWYMVFNVNKCHFLTLGFNEPFQNFSFNGNAIKNFTEEKILRILNDDKLNIKSHCVKGCNFTQFPGVETLRQGSSRACISTKYQRSVCLLNISGPVISPSSRNFYLLNNKQNKKARLFNTVRRRKKLVDFHIQTE